MASNLSSISHKMCMMETEQLLAPLFRWLIPIFVLAGIMGNSMILIVLNSSKSMRTKPHLLLSAMAAVDLVHTIVALVINLYLYEDLINSDSFRRIYHHMLKMPFLMVANWLSMMSTWLAVAVTIERLMAIRYPQKARFIRKRIIIAVIALISIISFLATVYYLFWLRPVSYISCQNPSKTLYRLYTDQRLWLYGHISRKVHSVLATFIPVILLFEFNALLVYHLHRMMRRFRNERNPEQMEISEWPNGDSSGQSVKSTFKREYKVAIVVLVISLTSAVCLLPSAALVIYDAVRLIVHNRTTPWWYFLAGEISNLLIMAEKTMDFFIYCLTSEYFRRRLIVVTTNRWRFTRGSDGFQSNRIVNGSEEIMEITNMDESTPCKV